MKKLILALILLGILLIPIKSPGVDFAAPSISQFIPPVIISKHYPKIAHIERQFDVTLLKSFSTEMLRTANIMGNRIILINSGGGDSRIGDAIIKLIKFEQLLGTRVICVVERQANSMAFNFMSNCDVRLSVAKGFCLVHKIEMPGVDTIVARKTAVFYREVARQLDEYDEKYRQLNSKTMNLSLDEYDYYANQETIWSANILYRIGYLNGFAEFKN